MLPVNRVVALLTPVFTVAAAAVSHLALTRFGFHLSSDALVGVETTAAASAAGAALKWLHGHQRYEAMLSQGVSAVGSLLPSDAQELAAPAPRPQSAVVPDGAALEPPAEG